MPPCDNPSDFKHSPKPSNVSELVVVNRSGEKYKTELCLNFRLKGFCKYLNFCQYAHGEQELKKRTHSEAYKTKICLNFEKKHQCAYGTRCQFIHKPFRKKSGRTILQLISKLSPLAKELDKALEEGEQRAAQPSSRLLFFSEIQLERDIMLENKEKRENLVKENFRKDLVILSKPFFFGF